MFTEQQLHEYLRTITPVSNAYDVIIQERLDSLTKPRGSLGFLEAAIIKLGAIQGKKYPQIKKRRVYTFAGDHGITQEGISAYPAAVTPQMVLNFLSGGASINVLAKQFNIELQVVDVGVNHTFENMTGLLQKKIAKGTKNFLHEPAMSREEAIAAIFVGIELARQAKEDHVELLIAGDMGIGNTTAASAICAVLCKQPPEAVTGMGTGISDTMLAHKIQIIASALQKRVPNPQDPIDILAKVGGYELGAIAGLALGCAHHKIPLIADGFISTAGVAIGFALSATVKEVLFPVECITEQGNNALLQFMHTPATLSLNVRLGEGTGAALLIPLLDAAINLYTNMATFTSAGVDDRE